MQAISKLFHPSPKPPPDTATSILAFRTITKLLGLIQQEQAFIASQDTGGPNDQQRLELKITNALSTVAVINHEVVAVVNNIRSGVGSGKVGLIAYVEPPNDTAPSESKSFLSELWKVIFSPNFRPDSDGPTTPEATEQPVIFSAQDPKLGGLNAPDLRDLSDLELKKYAEDCW